MTDQVANFKKVIVSTTYDDIATSIVLTTGHGAELPDPSGDNYNLVWWDSTNYPDPSDDPKVEVIRVTAKSSDTLTVTRNQEASGANTKNTSDAVYKMILSATSKTITDLQADTTAVGAGLTTHMSDTSTHGVAEIANVATVSAEIDSDITTHAGLGDAHHTESHTVASHSDTTATGIELETLTDGSDADSLHTHAVNDAKVTNATHTGDVTGATALTIGADKVLDSHINWGTAATQVSAVDIPIADAGVIITATEVEGALQEHRTAIDLNTAKTGVTTQISNIVEDTTPQLGGDLDTNSKNINAINQINTIENESKLLQTEDIFSDYVDTGLLPATSVNLISDISAGTAYVTGTRVVKAATSNTYTASVDTYVDINSVGTYTFIEVALDAAAPALTADSIRLAKVVTDVDNITGVTDLRTLTFSITGNDKLQHITVTQAVNLDTIESDTATNNAKVTNATHSGEVTGSGALTITDAAVTYTKIQNVVNDDVFLGRISGADGDVEEISKANALTLLSVEDGADVTDAFNVAQAWLGQVDKNIPIDNDTFPIADSAVSNVLKKVKWSNVKATLKTYFDTLYNLYSHPNHTGEVTSTGDGATVIASDAVTYDKMQDISATDKLLGRSTAGAGTIEEITCTAAGRAILDDVDAATQRTTLDVDQAGTDNSTDVTLAGTPDYITISGQILTRNQVDLTADITGNLPIGNLNSGTGASSSTFWRGDGTWVAPAGSGDMVLADIQTVTGAKTFGTIGGAVGKFILAGSTSGSSILNAAAAAGSTTLTLPAATDTLVGKATTDTFTNKTFDANGTGNSLSNIDIADLANGTDGELITWNAAGAPDTVAVGIATHILTSNGVGVAPTFQAAAGGSQTVNIFLPAESAYLPATNPATLIEELGSTVYGGYSTADFDDTTAEHIIFRCPVPDYDGNNITFKFYWIATATSGNVIWTIESIGITDGEEILEAVVTDLVDVTADTVTGTTLDLNVTTHSTYNPASVASDDLMIIEITRKSGTDTMTGDARLIAVNLEYTRA